jgi:hypothetical protein
MMRERDVPTEVGALTTTLRMTILSYPLDLEEAEKKR